MVVPTYSAGPPTKAPSIGAPEIPNPPQAIVRTIAVLQDADADAADAALTRPVSASTTFLLVRAA